MIRAFMILAILALFPSMASARDDGGFGASFTNTSPSALVPGAPPTLAQLNPGPEVNPSTLQEIMPAAGEEQVQPAPDEAVAPTVDESKTIQE